MVIMVYINAMSELSLKEQFQEAADKRRKPSERIRPVSTKRIDDTMIKHTAFSLLRQNGLNTEAAAKAMNYSKKYGYQLNDKVKKLDVADNKMVSLAHKTVKRLLKGETWGSITEVKDSTALAAAKEVLDRSQPKINMNQNINIDFSVNSFDINLVRSEPVEGLDCIETQSDSDTHTG